MSRVAAIGRGASTTPPVATGTPAWRVRVERDLVFAVGVVGTAGDLGSPYDLAVGDLANTLARAGSSLDQVLSAVLTYPASRDAEALVRQHARRFGAAASHRRASLPRRLRGGQHLHLEVVARRT